MALHGHEEPEGGVEDEGGGDVADAAEELSEDVHGELGVGS